MLSQIPIKIFLYIFRLTFSKCPVEINIEIWNNDQINFTENLTMLHVHVNDVVPNESIRDSKIYLN